jgi:hypothetical protein
MAKMAYATVLRLVLVFDKGDCVAMLQINADVMLITMKAMNSVTVVDEMDKKGGQPLWNTSHWMFTRNTLGHE